MRRKIPIGDVPLCKERLALTADGGRWGPTPPQPYPTPLVCGTGASPPCVPLDPSARVTWLTRQLNETPLHLHILMNIEKWSAHKTSCKLAIVGHLVSSCLFCFSKQLKNKLTRKKKMWRNKLWCVFFSVHLSVQSHGSQREDIQTSQRKHTLFPLTLPDRLRN